MVTYRWSVDIQTVRRALLHSYLGIAGQAVADLLPVNQVAAVIDRNARKILKAAVDKIEVPADPADAGIGMKTRNNWIAVFHRILHFSSLKLMK